MSSSTRISYLREDPGACQYLAMEVFGSMQSCFTRMGARVAPRGAPQPQPQPPHLSALSEEPLEQRPALGRHLLRSRAQRDACACPIVLAPVEKTESSGLLQEDIDYSMKVYGCAPQEVY